MFITCLVLCLESSGHHEHLLCAQRAPCHPGSRQAHTQDGEALCFGQLDSREETHLEPLHGPGGHGGQHTAPRERPQGGAPSAPRGGLGPGGSLPPASLPTCLVLNTRGKTGRLLRTRLSAAGVKGHSSARATVVVKTEWMRDPVVNCPARRPASEVSSCRTDALS